jgi:hypothetical protein
MSSAGYTKNCLVRSYIPLALKYFDGTQDQCSNSVFISSKHHCTRKCPKCNWSQYLSSIVEPKFTKCDYLVPVDFCLSAVSQGLGTTFLLGLWWCLLILSRSRLLIFSLEKFRFEGSGILYFCGSCCFAESVSAADFSGLKYKEFV